MMAFHQLEVFADLFVGRWSDYALQQPDGRYLRVGSPFSMEVLAAHLLHQWTCGTYVIDEMGLVRSAIFDADGVDGLSVLVGIQAQLARLSLPSYLEASRRGGHLWVLFSQPVQAALVRAWLLPWCPTSVEFYPKQDGVRPGGYGSLMRLPLGVHQRSGHWYPFVVWQDGGPVPVSRDLLETLEWLSTCVRVSPPSWADLAQAAAQRTPHLIDNKKTGLTVPIHALHGGAWPAGVTIGDWCAAQDPFTLIGRYVELDARGIGCCPFGFHHDDGIDRHPSLCVYWPTTPGGCCWHCYTWGKGGNVFNFLQYYYGLDARTLWSRLLAGESF